MEFLTPQDASAALSFDGKSFDGSVLKLRRPKDYSEVTVRIITMRTSFFLSLWLITIVTYVFFVN